MMSCCRGKTSRSRSLGRCSISQSVTWPEQTGLDVDWDSALESFLIAHEQAGMSGNDTEFLDRLLRTQIPFFKAEGSSARVRR